MWLTTHLYTTIHSILTGCPKCYLSFIHLTNIYEIRHFANKEGEMSTRTKVPRTQDFGLFPSLHSLALRTVPGT